MRTEFERERAATRPVRIQKEDSAQPVECRLRLCGDQFAGLSIKQAAVNGDLDSPNARGQDRLNGLERIRSSKKRNAVLAVADGKASCVCVSRFCSVDNRSG